MNNINKDSKAEKIIYDIMNILMSSDAVSCDVECFEPVKYLDNILYHIPSEYLVQVDYAKLAQAVYDAGYRKEENEK